MKVLTKKEYDALGQQRDLFSVPGNFVSLLPYDDNGKFVKFLYPRLYDHFGRPTITRTFGISGLKYKDWFIEFPKLGGRPSARARIQHVTHYAKDGYVEHAVVYGDKRFVLERLAGSTRVGPISRSLSSTAGRDLGSELTGPIINNILRFAGDPDFPIISEVPKRNLRPKTYIETNK